MKIYVKASKKGDWEQVVETFNEEMEYHNPLDEIEYSKVGDYIDDLLSKIQMRLGIVVITDLESDVIEIDDEKDNVLVEEYDYTDYIDDIAQIVQSSSSTKDFAKKVKEYYKSLYGFKWRPK